MKQVNLAQTPNYGHEAKWKKAKRKINSIIVETIENTPFQFRLYRSYWHYKLTANKKTVNVSTEIRKTHYLTEKPNYGAGIGHQLANWNTGLFFAGYFNIQFAHSPFSTRKWDYFLGLGQGEVNAADLEKNRLFKIVRLPRFDSTNAAQVLLVKNIVASYNRSNILFRMESDQAYEKQWETYKILSQKFFSAEARQKDKIIFAPDSLNIAIHIRRRMKIESVETWKSRGLENKYYSNALSQLLATIKTTKKIDIYLFSQGPVEDFPEFSQFENMHYKMDMGPVESVLHMIYADVLISSKSSFSYKPALISKGIKICPVTFWHQYPPTPDFIMADNDGNFDNSQLAALTITR